MLYNYSKTLIIEATTMADMARKEILPAVESYALEIANTAAAKKSVIAGISTEYEEELLKKLTCEAQQISVKTDELNEEIMKVKDISDIEEKSYAIRDGVLVKMNELRAVADEAETVTAEKYWPFPTYGDLLFGIK